MRIAVLGLCIVALTGCEQTTTAVDNAARASAKKAVTETLVTRFPAVPKAAITPFTDCVIDNASRFEIFEIAKAGATGVTPATIETVTTISTRPETVQCISKNGLGLFL